MGFKCPDCGMEFGNDKQAFVSHLKANNDCRNVAETILMAKEIEPEALFEEEESCH